MIPISLCGASASAEPGDRSLFMLHGAGHVRPVARAPPRSGLLRQYEGITALKRGLQLPASPRSAELALLALRLGPEYIPWMTRNHAYLNGEGFEGGLNVRSMHQPVLRTISALPEDSAWCILFPLEDLTNFVTGHRRTQTQQLRE